MPCPPSLESAHPRACRLRRRRPTGPPAPRRAPRPHRTRPPFDSLQSTNKLSAANKLSIRCAWAGTPAFTSAGYGGSSWAPGTCPATFTSKASLLTAVQAFNGNPTAATATYGLIANWDVSAITDMYQLFYNLKNFNADISSWDTSGVTTLSQMFRYASAFNQPLSWDTSRVTNMFGMFWVRKSRAHCGPAAVGLSSCLHFRRPNSCSPLPTRSSRPAPYIPLSTLGRERMRLTSR